MIISKRHLGNFKPNDIIPDGYYDAAALARHVKKKRVVIVADEAKEQVEKIPNYADMTLAELRDLVKQRGLKVSKRSKKAMIEALTNGDN